MKLTFSDPVDDMDVYEWWILDNGGKILAKFNWPRDKAIRVIKNDKIYVETEDEETGAKSIVRYRFVMEPKP